MECSMCDIEFDEKPEFLLHAFTHIIEHNRGKLEKVDNRKGFIEGFDSACEDWKLTDKEIEKIRPRAEYLLEINVRK